jgi:hypothetical protein
MNLIYALGGLVLLLFGRRLFWFFVASAGFAAGMFWARDQLHLDSEILVFAIAIFAGVIGALLSVFLQKLAIALAGFASGGYLAAMLLTKVLNSQPFAWIGFIVGGILGAVLLLTIFDWALIILSYWSVGHFLRTAWGHRRMR